MNSPYNYQTPAIPNDRMWSRCKLAGYYIRHLTLLCKILRAWTSGSLRAVTTTSMATLACVPDKEFTLVEVAMNSFSAC